MKSFGAKEITDEIVEHDDLATKSSFSFSRKFALGEATCQSAYRKQKKLVFFSGQKNVARKKGLFSCLEEKRKKNILENEVVTIFLLLFFEWLSYQ